jgi:ribose-phosphate pyrophosphokinase
MYTVIGGPSSQNLAKKLAKRLDSNYVPANIQVFPDGESKITIPKIKGKIIIVNKQKSMQVKLL